MNSTLYYVAMTGFILTTIIFFLTYDPAIKKSVAQVKSGCSTTVENGD